MKIQVIIDLNLQEATRRRKNNVNDGEQRHRLRIMLISFKFDILNLNF